MIATPIRNSGDWEITSGLPDDSREEDERAEDGGCARYVLE